MSNCSYCNKWRECVDPRKGSTGYRCRSFGNNEEDYRGPSRQVPTPTPRSHTGGRSDTN